MQYIYATYLTGASFQHLAKELDKRDVPYDAGKRWNVNMVARILEDSRYIGTEVYPALISGAASSSAGASKAETLYPLEPPRRLNFTGCAAAQSPTALREKSSRY